MLYVDVKKTGENIKEERMDDDVRTIYDNVSVIIRVMRHVLNYADAARKLFIVMYGVRHVPEFYFGRDYDGNIHLNVCMEGKECCKIKRVIPCEIILSARDPINVVYKTLEDMHRLLTSYEE